MQILSDSQIQYTSDHNELVKTDKKKSSMAVIQCNKFKKINIIFKKNAAIYIAAV